MKSQWKIGSESISNGIVIQYTVGGNYFVIKRLC